MRKYTARILTRRKTRSGHGWNLSSAGNSECFSVLLDAGLYYYAHTVLEIRLALLAGTMLAGSEDEKYKNARLQEIFALALAHGVAPPLTLL